MSEPSMGRAQSQPNMDIQAMYKIATREDEQWGIEGYQVAKKYQDHIKSKKQGEIAEMQKANKKPGWPAPKATKRGNFLDDYTKIQNKLYPGPNKIPVQYNLPDDWKMKDETFKQYATKNKVDMKADKNTYIGAIFKYNKKNNFPAAGAYNVTKTQKQTEEDMKKMHDKVIKYEDNKPNFLNDYQWCGNQTPGPGQYVARGTGKDTFEWENQKKFLTGNVYYKVPQKEWMEKHNKKKPKVDMSKIDPFPVSFDTFGKKMENTKEGKDKTAVKHWGTEKRIRSLKEEMEVTKKLNRMAVPGAGTYGMQSKWKDCKPDDKKAFKSKSQQFNYNQISKGTQSTRSIYY